MEGLWGAPDVDAVIISAIEEQWDDVHRALDHGFPPNALHSGSRSGLLHYLSCASSHPEGRLAAVHHALAKGADPNARGLYGWTPLWKACWTGSSSVLRALVEAGGDPSACADDGKPALLMAVSSENADAPVRLRVLLDQPDVDLHVVYAGKTVEQWARDGGRVDLADMIAAEATLRSRWSPHRSAWLTSVVRMEQWRARALKVPEAALTLPDRDCDAATASGGGSPAKRNRPAVADCRWGSKSDL